MVRGQDEAGDLLRTGLGEPHVGASRDEPRDIDARWGRQRGGSLRVEAGDAAVRADPDPPPAVAHDVERDASRETLGRAEVPDRAVRDVERVEATSGPEVDRPVVVLGDRPHRIAREPLARRPLPEGR
jgi:hypothetical protein